MKKTFFAIITLASVSTFAFPELDLAARAEACLPLVDSSYNSSRPIAEKINPVTFEKVLFANETYDYGMKSVGNYDTDKLLYSVTGSEHSGWFQDAIVVDILTCEVAEIINIYSE